MWNYLPKYFLLQCFCVSSNLILSNDLNRRCISSILVKVMNYNTKVCRQEKVHPPMDSTLRRINLCRVPLSLLSDVDSFKCHCISSYFAICSLTSCFVSLLCAVWRDPCIIFILFRNRIKTTLITCGSLGEVGLTGGCVPGLLPAGAQIMTLEVCCITWTVPLQLFKCIRTLCPAVRVFFFFPFTNGFNFVLIGENAYKLYKWLVIKNKGSQIPYYYQYWLLNIQS